MRRGLCLGGGRCGLDPAFGAERPQHPCAEARVCVGTCAVRATAARAPPPLRAWVGAICGGSTRPWSSECVMTSAPISRVLTPHEVAHTCSCELSDVWNCTSNALAKFCGARATRTRHALGTNAPGTNASGTARERSDSVGRGGQNEWAHGESWGACFRRA
eukprot:6394025-Prymnesium_polylepis.1